MTKNNHIEDELDVIRIALYEATMNMTPEERVAYLRELAKPVNREYGIEVVPGVHCSVQRKGA